MIVNDEFYRALIVAFFVLQSVLSYLVPVVGSMMSFIHLSWLYALFFFEYKFSLADWNLEKRLVHLEERWCVLAAVSPPSVCVLPLTAFLCELEEFAFDCATFDTLQSFVDTAAANGISRLRRLSIASIDMTPEARVHDFLGALGDSTHPLAVQLQELNLTFKIPDSSVDTILSSATEMLLKSRRLWKVQLTFDLRDDLQHLKTSIRAAIKEAHDEKPWIRIGAVPFRSKLAFVGVSQGDNGLVELDRSIVGAIFELAAPMARRELNVEFKGTF